MSQHASLVVLGDALLDRDVDGTVERLSPDAPAPVLDEASSSVRPGGAALAAALAARDGPSVTLVTALADDQAAGELRAALGRSHVDVVDLGLSGSTPEKIRFLADERLLMRLDRGTRTAAVGPATAAARAAIGWADAILVSDYGRGMTSEPGLREAITEARRRVPVVWDPHPRGAAPVPGLAVATPNEREARQFSPHPPERDVAAAADRGTALRRAWNVEAVCMTCGPRGALLLPAHGEPLTIPAALSPRADPCGAGDRFASRLAGALADGMPLRDAALEAVVTASAFVSAGGARDALGEPKDAATVEPEEALGVAARVRADGGTVVATGGCFDLLHAGHLRTLEAARALGDCLVVCLNSDASVRRLKGPRRPLVPQHERASVLAALSCVDTVIIFDEDTPEQVLRTLRPHVWAKGGDYEGVTLPEAATLAEWGGRAVLLPYVGGHSTSRLIEEAANRG